MLDIWGGVPWGLSLVKALISMMQKLNQVHSISAKCLKGKSLQAHNQDFVNG